MVLFSNIRDLGKNRKDDILGIRFILLVIYGLLNILILSFVFTSCDTADDRDFCCEETVLYYRYVRQDIDEYEKFVHNMRHFLFDDRGVFLYEIPSPTNSPQKIVLDGLPKGSYTIITLGNSTSINEKLSQLTKKSTPLDTFKLAVNNASNGIYANTDELFFNSRTIELKKGEKQKFVCDLSNIHCHLFVRVRWHTLPKHNGTYTMQISNVARENILSPSQADSLIIRDKDPNPGTTSTEKRVIHSFPAMQASTESHAIKVSLYNLELDGEFITLRYANDRIPVFQLFFEGKPVSKLIDLSKAFAEWSWRPDEHSEQIYRIDLELFDDGKIIVKQWAATAVSDWEDGGAINTER